MHFGEKPVEIASATEDSHVPSSAPLSLLIPTAEKENKHAGLMEKKCSVKKIKTESILLNLTEKQTQSI